MQLLDYDYDDGKYVITIYVITIYVITIYVITIEATHGELFHIVSSVEFANHALISDHDKNVMKQLHDFILNVISQNK